MRNHRERAEAISAATADRLASPAVAQRLGLPQGWHPQSLAYGAAGIALLHIERARAGLGPWQRAHDWLACAVEDGVITGPDSHLHYGAPALAVALQAAADRSGRYARALDKLDRHIAVSTCHRLESAHARMDKAVELPALAEFDAVRGLSGIGAHLLRREPHGELLRDILVYLVRLTEPVQSDGGSLPGWWSAQAPSGRVSPDFPGGHANHGMAHGIAGPLALLALSALADVRVDGQAEAIGVICSWLDRWRQEGTTGSWWPALITRAQLRGEQLLDTAPSRPSWCYGTAGHARSQQLAALATGGLARQRMAEAALVGALSDPAQLAATTDKSLCHGYAGLAHTAGRAAADALTPDIGARVPMLLDAIGADPGALKPSATPTEGGDIGLLEGAAGVALALHTISAGTPSPSGWDTFLLIS
ncbi:lanthionine synthetase C family protein [Streptomyces uncialis]|uniref:lanthionine synthetase C family protein n=1 Tax=Streptomyces uncialis TaxID=1048205 RepID=UPI003821E811